MMAGVDQNLRLRAGGAGERRGHAPIGNVSVIEGGLERLVLDQHALVRRKLAMRFAQAFFKKTFSLPDVGGARIVRSVGEPQADVAAIEVPCDGDAFPRMSQRLRANLTIRVPEG